MTKRNDEYNNGQHCDGNFSNGHTKQPGLPGFAKRLKKTTNELQVTRETTHYHPYCCTLKLNG